MSFLKKASSILRQKPSSRERIMVFVALFAFGFLFVRMGVLEPMKAKEKIQESLVELEKERDELKKKAIAAARPTEKKQSPSTEDEGIAWIGKKEFIELAADALVLAAKQNNIALLKFNFSNQSEENGLIHKPISLTLTGSLANLGRYLEATEHLAVPLVVRRFSFEPSSDFANIVTLRVEGGFYAKM